MTNCFDEKVFSVTGGGLYKEKIEILQINVGKLCNLSCSHCHVEAGPSRTQENMDRRTVEAVVEFLTRSRAETLDITGGAPEMNPHFRYLVTKARGLGRRVIDRCNLTVFYEPGQEDTARFLAENQVEVIASLPCYTSENVDKQRGQGVFDESIRALIELNRLGYGKPDSELSLNLVYNPVGPHLPALQKKMEEDYKLKLRNDFGILFNRLYTITNMPITRYAKYLKAFGQLEDYQKLLFESFNPSTLGGLMCRNTLSISWDGTLYDCDFNQALHMSMGNGRPLTIFDPDKEEIENRRIKTAEHCFGCTAGTGSSCQGAIQ